MAKKQFTLPLTKYGRSLPYGLVYTYIAGTTNPKATYSSASGANVNPNPVRLNENGEASIFLNAGEPYRIVVKDVDENIVWEFDNIVLTDEPAKGWFEEKGSVQYLSSTQFTVEGDKRTIYTYPRKVKLLQPSGGTGYVSSATYDAPSDTTTVTLLAGSDSVERGIQGVLYSNSIESIPESVLKNALSGDIKIECVPSSASSSAATVTAAAAGTYQKTITIRLVDSAGNIHKWANLDLVATTSESVADTSVLAPTVSDTSPTLVNGEATVTLTYDTDGGSTKTYVAGDSITLTVSAPASGILGYPVADATFVDTFV